MFIKEVSDVRIQLYKVDEKDEQLHSFIDNMIEYVVVGHWDEQISFQGLYL